MGDFRHGTDRVDGQIIAECPNKEAPYDDHLSAVVEYEESAINDLPETFKEAFGTCGECGAELDFIANEKPSEVIE